MNSSAQAVSRQFNNTPVIEIAALGNGLINDTFLIKTKKNQFVLQRINSLVFSEPQLIMENLLLLNQHIKQKNISDVKLIIPKLLKTINQQPFYIDKQNSYWRALEFINKTTSKEFIKYKDEAIQVGFALGHFHCLLSDVHVDSFHDTLPGFHSTPRYFQQYHSIENKYIGACDSKKILFCEKFIDEFQANITVLEDAKNKGLLIERITHGDPKLNNFLFDQNSGKIVSIIDLDTVKPGLLQYDIADCLRSCCHNQQENSFDLDKCSGILNSYLEQVSVFFTEQDYEFLYPAIQLLPFELGLRFFTDFLQGNYYFKVTYPEHNLNRAIAQFQLCESIEKQEVELRRLIKTQ